MEDSATHRVRVAIERLSPRLRRIVRDRLCDPPWPWADIGRGLGISGQAARQQHRRALILLRRELEVG